MTKNAGSKSPAEKVADRMTDAITTGKGGPFTKAQQQVVDAARELVAEKNRHDS